MAFTETFSAMNRMLRQTKRSEAFYFKNSPFVRSNNESPEFSKAMDLQHIQSTEQQEDESDDTGKSSTGPLNLPSPGSKLRIHCRALKLPRLSTVNQFAFVTLYNLALSTHLSALLCARSVEKTPTEPTSVTMHTAAKLWALVYSFQWRPALNLKPVHALAVLVNLGYAQCGVGNIQGSKRCFENILSAIQILEGRNQTVPNRSFFVYSAFRMLSGDKCIAVASAA